MRAKIEKQRGTNKKQKGATSTERASRRRAARDNRGARLFACGGDWAALAARAEGVAHAGERQELCEYCRGADVLRAECGAAGLLLWRGERDKQQGKHASSEDTAEKALDHNHVGAEPSWEGKR